jgi:trimeric autotransporter adhesin
MKTKIQNLFIALSILASINHVSAQGTAFTYQGQLQNNGGPATGLYDFQFSLSNAPSGGSQIGSTITNLAVGVTNGLFTTTLDFGFVFTGNATWLAMSVRTNGAGSYTGLNPLQPVTPVPYAIFANAASNVSGTVSAAQLSGTVPLAQMPNAVVTNNATSVALGNVTVNGSLNVPGTTATIYNGGATLFHWDAVNNFFAGPGAGNLTMTGNGNVGIGFNALANNTSGIANTANGFWALINNAGGSYNTANGNQSLARNVSGNNNTATGWGALNSDTAGNNTANGMQALRFNTTGSDNTANGFDALLENTTGIQNTANGSVALWNNTIGSYNTANGYDAMANNTSGNDNTANGDSALFSNTTGHDNTANGFLAMVNNLTGNYNAANGDQALKNNSSGNNNTANGWGALLANTTGSANTADGLQALLNNITGNNNVAVGQNAGFYLTNGSYNILLGFGAGQVLTTGSSNIDIGNYGVAGDNNIVRIGSSQTATYLAGDVYGNSFNATSDRNAKENFHPLDYQAVLDKVAALPVTQWNYKTDSKGVQHIGPMAQDFQAAFQLSVDDKHISVVDEGGVALAAIQGLNQKLEEKNAEKDAEIQDLKQSVAELKKLVQTLAEKK